jgi:hypothetical protein
MAHTSSPDDGASSGFPGIGPANTPGLRTFEGMRGAIRTYLRDFSQNNRLLGEEETSDPMLDLAIVLTLDDFNRTPHITGFSIEVFPSYYLLLLGSVIQVLRSAGIMQSRNRLNYNEGGISVAVSDKAADYQQWIASMFNEYERKKRELKIAINLTGAFGSMPSEYIFLDRDLFF